MRLLAALSLLAVLFLPELRAGHAGGVESLSWASLDYPAAQGRTSRPAWPGPFPVRVLRVRDGDTVDVLFSDGPCGRGPCPAQELAIRIYGIDAPEAHRCGKGLLARSGGMSCAACPQEYALGQQAREWTANFIRDAPARVAGVRPDKYGGRVVADIQVLRDGRWLSVADGLLQARLAVPYDGSRKVKPWCGGAR